MLQRSMESEETEERDETEESEEGDETGNFVIEMPNFAIAEMASAGQSPEERSTRLAEQQAAEDLADLWEDELNDPGSYHPASRRTAKRAVWIRLKGAPPRLCGCRMTSSKNATGPVGRVRSGYSGLSGN